MDFSTLMERARRRGWALVALDLGVDTMGGHTMKGVHGHVVNGDRWIAQRLAHLRELLAGELSDEQRKAIEAEIAVLSQERGFVLGGLRLPRFFRRWRRRERRNQDGEALPPSG